ncbi:MAG: DUF3298 and DUF4163 domain-containing protein [Clostridium butyricum]|nr:DUF3298 and DUF4163 domain-containing protein [Clostridium butyricum]
MNVFQGIEAVLLITFSFCTTYPQNVLKDCGLIVENKIEINERVITNDYKYLKENIKIPKLKNDLFKEKIELINNSIAKDILPKVSEAEKISKEYFDNATGIIPKFPFEIESVYTITLNNPKLISIYNDYYEYLGGAHGMTTRTSYTIDKENIRLLKLQDLFKKEYSYKDVINNEIIRQIKLNPDIYFNSGNDFKGIGDNQNYYLDNNNLIIYYQLYEIAPYVAGIREFKIPIQMFGENFLYV